MPASRLCTSIKSSGAAPAAMRPVDASGLRSYAAAMLRHRLDLKNQQYQQAIKQGDLVLNRLQKLAKVADVE